mgnify:CR=1 FL=1
MSGETYLTIAIFVAVVAALLWFTGPLANKLHVKMRQDLDRKKREMKAGNERTP